MINLLSEGFGRLKKNRLFYLGIAIMLGLGFFVIWAKYRDMTKYHMIVHADDAVFTIFVYLQCAVSVFSALFIGTQYSDGVIRNKIIAGHSRANVYLSNFIVTVSAAIIMLFAFFAVYVPLALALFEPPVMSAVMLAKCFFLGIASVLSSCALFTLISMLCSKKATSAVICILLFFAMLMSITMIINRLEAPEYASGYYMDSSGELAKSDPEPNPKYLRGFWRTFYELMLDIIPAGQAIKTVTPYYQSYFLIMAYAVIEALAFSGVGIYIFSKKNIN